MPEQPKPESEADIAAQLEKTLAGARLLFKTGERTQMLRAKGISTSLGPIILAGDDEHLHLLAFLNDEVVMVRIIAHLMKVLKAKIEPGETAPIKQAQQELDEYFAGTRREFSVPVAYNGTSFQVTVWKAIRNTPFGQTITYSDLARDIGRPSSFRAAAQACSQNPTAIIVPCHRVINSNGELGGYLGGLERKIQLLDFEKKEMKNSR